MADVLPFGATELQGVLTGSGQSLPGPAYTDPAVLAFEQTHFFSAGWVCIGRADDLSSPGDRRAYAIGDDGVLVVRGVDGVLRGFFNSCRHRGHELLPCGGQASGKFIRCPYHAWVFTTEGDLHGVAPSHQADVEGRTDLGLNAVSLEEWHGFLFVNVSGDAPALSEYLEGLEELVADYSMDSLVVGDTHSYDLETNWKLIVENYHECFHCDTIHPELCVVSSPESGESFSALSGGLWLGGSMDLRDGVETMSLDGKSLGVRIPSLPLSKVRDVLYIHLFPNLLISLHQDFVMTHRIVASAPDRTHVECQWLFPKQAWDREGFTPSYAVDFWDITNRQDWTACESVQRGVSSRGYSPGPLAQWHEIVVGMFTSTVARGYISGSLPKLVTPESYAARAESGAVDAMSGSQPGGNG
ncbi:MAG TPA: aromatic ring-hydroxylating dioxygenase subunit alpha [Actinomycetes bacterium]|nr:aromatic ring-hydroxylating dioxygenase subunit alpha [Actinomycetes bacterium]